MNTRKTVLATLLAALAVTPFAITPLQAQAQVQAAAHVYTQAELDQMLAPIALYPDALLSQVLMAATYPIEVTEAARWSRANPGLQGDDAVRAVQDEDWDPSVKSLVAFPQILQRMDENREWTRSLGDAFLAQQPQMMDQVQQLRQRAESTGNLRSDEQIRVVREGPVIVVRPARPDYIYVPYYDPLVVYGPWWWADYRPVYWAPWPGYVRPRASYGFWWGRPVGLSLNFFFGDFDWNRRHVRIAHANSYYYRQPRFANSYYAGDRSRWYHDSFHRRGVDYRNTTVRQRYTNEAYVLGQQQSARRGSGDWQTQREQRRAGGAGAQTQQSNTFGQQPAGTDRQALREQRRAERNATQGFTAPRQAQPQPQMQQAPQPNILGGQRPARIERQEQRIERREARQAQQPQPQAQPRFERRFERREERQAQPQSQAQPRFERRFERREERQAQPQSQARPQPQARQERRERPSMPAAQAPQTPRAEARGGMRILGQ